MPDDIQLASTAHTESKKETPAKAKRSRKGFVKNFAFLLLIVAVALSLFMYWRSRQEVQRLQTLEGQQEVNQREIDAVMSSLGKLTLLPDEDPIVATIIDADYLATQSAFYQRSQNGDKLVVFPEAQKAYIYSPARNIIVNAGPVIGGNQQSVKVAIRNGSTSTGAAEQLRQLIEGNGVEVTQVGSAANQSYAQTLVVPLTDLVPAAQLQTFATNLGGQIAQNMPASEAASDADILIIIGASGFNTPQDVASQPAASPSPSPSPVASPETSPAP